MDAQLKARCMGLIMNASDSADPEYIATQIKAVDHEMKAVATWMQLKQLGAVSEIKGFISHLNTSISGYEDGTFTKDDLQALISGFQDGDVESSNLDEMSMLIDLLDEILNKSKIGLEFIRMVLKILSSKNNASQLSMLEQYCLIDNSLILLKNKL